MGEEILYLRNVTADRRLGKKLDYVSLSLRRGEILGVTGLEDSGVYDLADVLTGTLIPDSGEVYLEGEKVCYDSREGARRLGIYNISVRDCAVPFMSLSDNLNLLSRFSLIHKKKELEKTGLILEKYHICGKADEIAGEKTAGSNLAVAIYRAILCGAKVLVCREMGAEFSPSEAEDFAEFLWQLRDEGFSLILIGSGIEDIVYFSDRVMVMREGMVCYDRPSDRTTVSDIYRIILPVKPRELSRWSCKTEESVKLSAVCPIKRGAPLLNVNLYKGAAIGVCLETVDNDMLCRMFNGAVRTSGMAFWEGKRISFESWCRSNRQDIYCLGSRFWEKNLYENMTIAENIRFRSHRRYRGRLGFLNQRMLRLSLREFCEKYQVEFCYMQMYPQQVPAEIRNQIVIWSLLFFPPRFLILDHPFYTIDERIKQMLLWCVEELKSKGTAILWNSRDIITLSSCCDYVAVSEG